MEFDKNIKRAMPIYIGTVCLEKNRWGSKEPSFKVSDWVERFRNDGFEGIELWENHYLLSNEAERAALISTAVPIAIFNTYASFSDDATEARKHAADAIKHLNIQALKYNLGHKPEMLDEYRRNLMIWADELPSDCRLLCECHQGTVLETPEAAAAFHKNLDPNRFGIIVHPSPAADQSAAWFHACGDRIAHLHMQLRGADTNPTTETGRDFINACISNVRDHNFNGSMTVEFTRGIGKNEEIEVLYANACADLKYLRKIIS